MEIKNTFKVRHLVNILLGAWIIIWVYFAVFNWDVFAVKINMNLGFSVVKSYPFLFFFLLGLAVIIAVRYLLQYSRMLRRLEVKEKTDKIKMQAKDIEILQLKELLYKMQTDEHSKTAVSLNDMHKRLEEIAEQFDQQRKEVNEETKNEK